MAASAPIFDLDPKFRMIEMPTPALSPGVTARIQKIWASEKTARGGRLFDGPVLSLVKHAHDRLEVRRMFYRHLLAAIRAPELGPAIGMHPLGVCGVLTCRDGIVFGRRAQHVAVQPGYWELAPCGTMNQPEASHVLLDELEQELGLDAKSVSKPAAFALVRDGNTGVFDILMRFSSDLTEAQIKAAHKRASDEYSEIAVVPTDRLTDFFYAQDQRILPIVPVALRRAGLLLD